MRTPRVRLAREEREYFFEEGCHILEIGNSPEDPDVSVARARVEPGMKTRWHCLRDTTERYVIVCGQGLVDIGELGPRPVGPGDFALIPAGVRQRITNTGSRDLVFLAICSPRFQPGNYEDLELEEAPP